MAKKKKTTKATTTTVTKGDTVELHYVGTLDTGEQFDSTYDRGAPVKVEVGNGLLIKGFDKALVGMEIGKKSTVKIGKEEAYGDPRPEAFVQVNKQGFPEDFDYTLGNFDFTLLFFLERCQPLYLLPERKPLSLFRYLLATLVGILTRNSYQLKNLDPDHVLAIYNLNMGDLFLTKENIMADPLSLVSSSTWTVSKPLLGLVLRQLTLCLSTRVLSAYTLEKMSIQLNLVFIGLSFTRYGSTGKSA
jgi:hypothetical protein